MSPGEGTSVIPDQKQHCPACGTPSAHEVKLLIKTDALVHLAAVGRIGYALPDAKRSFWTGRPPVEGEIAAFLCDRCGVVTFHAIPKEEPGPAGEA